jgi:phosphatidylethanolamine/phosphatidyl-N-methylethanolamine N-methyltransferase
VATVSDGTSSYWSDLSRFLFTAIFHPIQTGAVAPSSPWLGRAMAAVIDPSHEGRFLELGPGTGALTAALVARGVAPERITAVEFNPFFARMIGARFPGIDIVCGDACDLAKTLGERKDKFAGAISGVPLLNFPMELRQKFVTGVLARLEPGAPFAQFSYGLVGPSVPPPAGAYVGRAAVVLRNIPPAQVWVYRTA